MRRVITGAIAGLFLFCSYAHAQTADWEVVYRFRVLGKSDAGTRALDQDRYVDRVISIRDAGTYVPLIPASKGKDGRALNWTTAWDESKQQYQWDWFHSRVRSVRVSLKGVPKTAECVWDPVGIAMTNSSCGPHIFNKVPLDKVTPVKIAVTPKKGRPVKTLKVDVKPHDVVIAMIGDSYGSGEGNPHLNPVPDAQNDTQPIKYPAIWWDTRCHRSLLSSAAQASGFLAFQNKKQSVTFVSYACSGAEIEEGILGPFAGRQTVPQTREMWEAMGQPTTDLPELVDSSGAPRKDKDTLRPQIDVLSDLLCKSAGNCSEKVQPDVLLVTIGGNDIAFGEIGRDLLLKNPPSGKEEREKWRKENEDRLNPIFDRLSQRFEKLAKAVRTKINPKSVYLYEYVDPTQYGFRKGKPLTCGSKGDASNRHRYGKLASQFKAKSFKGSFAPGSAHQRLEAYAKNFSLYNLLLTQDEGEFAHWVVQNLDGLIRDAGNKLVWTDSGAHATVLPLEKLLGPDDLPRGVCAKNSWFIGIFESWTKQDWIPEDAINSYPLILVKKQSDCAGGEWKHDQCWVHAGPVTSGVLHPNFFGHYNVGQVLLRKLKENLAAAPAAGPATAQNVR